MTLDAVTEKTSVSIETPNIEQLFKKAVGSLRDHVRQENPDLIVCSGKSSPISIELCPPELRERIIIIDDKLNHDMSYESPNTSESTTVGNILERIMSVIPLSAQATIEEKKVMCLDEFISTGRKAAHYEKWLKKVGFLGQNISSSYLATSPMRLNEFIDPTMIIYIDNFEFAKHNIFVADKSPELHKFIINMTQKLSSGEISKEQTKAQIDNLLN